MSDNPLRFLPDCFLQYSQARIGLTKPSYKPTDKTI